MKSMQKAFKHSKPVWAAKLRSFPVFTLSIFAALFPAQSFAKEGFQTLIFDVYAGGIHAVEAKLTFDLTKKDRYSIVLDAHTRGFLGKLAPWNGTFESHGWILPDNVYRPELHKSVTTWRDEVETSEYKYGKDGSFKEFVITEHGKEPLKKDIEAELTKDTSDVLTATLEVLNTINNGGKCEGATDIFDGKRRFTQKFVHQKEVDLKTSNYNLFNGKAEECTVEVIPGAGKWHSKPRGWMSIQEQGRERGTMPTVWMGQMEEGESHVPIKIRVKTSYGTLFMHLAEYQYQEKVLIAEKRK